ncbi:hypothetical protein A3Q56_07216, partial [Intoshia linei]
MKQKMDIPYVMSQDFFESVSKAITYPKDGGEDCANFLPTRRKIIESVIAIIISLIIFNYSYPRIRYPKHKTKSECSDRVGKKLVLAFICMIFGVEVGFKLSTDQLTYLLNPCHILTITQIFLLVLSHNKYSMAIFRIHLHSLHGAILALLFPVLNTRYVTFLLEILC